MKRIIICSVLLAGIIAVCIFSYYTVARFDREINQKIDVITQTLQADDRVLLQQQVDELATYWEKSEDTLVHFIRHSHIDNISTSIARLPSLTTYGDTAEVSAELANIRKQIQHIHHSEKFSFENLF